MLLYAALGESLLYIKGPGRETDAAWVTALEIAERLDDTDYQLRALYGMWACRNLGGDYQASLAQRFCSLAAKQADPADMLIGDRMTGVVLHFLGDQASAREHIERMLARYVAPIRRSHTIRFQYDQRVVGAAFLARILWLQGFPDRAMSTVQSIVDDPPVIGHARSLCIALAQAACPISLFVGDLPAMERAVATLLDEAVRHALANWHTWGRAFEGMLFIKRGDAVNGLGLLRTAQGELRETGFVALYTEILRALAEALAGAGEVAEGLVTIDEALARSERDEERWCLAELLRIKGDLVLQEGGLDSAEAAEGHFLKALDWARRQGALSWELRTATSLSRLWRDQGRTQEAHRLLAPIYDRFTEGFATADLRAAEALIR